MEQGTDFDWVYWAWMAGKVLLVLLLAVMTFFTVNQQNAVVIQRFGKFVRVANAGLGMRVPLIDSVSDEISLRIEQLDPEIETKTKDDVFVKVKASIQYRVRPEKVYEAYYKLQEPKKQITAYVFDAVRAKVPNMELDDAFSNKDEIAKAIKEELAAAMETYGYEIVQALVTDIEPDEKVKHSMNEINAQKRLRMAATEQGEANRILLVSAARAESESKELQGQGIAKQRLAIARGLKDSISELAGIEGVHAAEAMQMISLNQYLDALVHMTQHGKTNTIMVPLSPAGATDLADQIRNSMLVAGKALQNGAGPKEPVAAADRTEERSEDKDDKKKDDASTQAQA